MADAAHHAGRSVRSHRTALILLSFFTFISLGLPDMVNGTAWPEIRRTFDRPPEALAWLSVPATLGYLLSTFFTGWLMSRLGVGRLLLVSTLLIVTALAGFALTPSWRLMVAISVLSGLGAGAIDAAINAYASGRFSPRVINWLHACWGVGAAVGPTLVAAIITGGRSWRYGYGTLAVLLMVMSIGFIFTINWWDQADPAGPSDTPPPEPVSLASVLRRPMVWAQLALFFLYTGFEITVGHWSVSLLTESRKMDPAVGTYVGGGFLAGLTLGRIIFGMLTRRVPPILLLRGALLCAPLIVACIWFDFGNAATFTAICVLGFVIAPVYPMMISLTPGWVGPAATQHVVSLQVCAAYLGTCVIFVIAGGLVRATGLGVLPAFLLLLALCVLLVFEATQWVRRRQSPASTLATTSR